MKIYIAGPMTGLNDFNFPAFHTMALRLRALGYDVVSPAENFGGRQDLPYKIYMKAAVKSLIGCDAVAVLPGWMNSRGACFEVSVADNCGIPVLNAELLARNEEQNRERIGREEFQNMTRVHVPLAVGLAVGAMLAALALVFLSGCAASLPHSLDGLGH